jgi:hypothetical protein
MSNVVVTSLSLRTVDNTILASTFGRGFYTGQFKGNDLTIWTGAIDTDWTNIGNWSNGLPTSDMDVKIPNTTIKPILNTTITIDNLSVELNAELILNEQAALTLKENLTNEGTLTINSSETNSGSIIVEGDSTGNIIYNRYVSTNWHLVSSPVTDQDYNNDWVAANSISSGTINPDLRGIAAYDNNLGSWDYMLEGESSSFTAGKGYSMLRMSAGNLSFTGSVITTSITKDIVKGTSNAFNLIGNVYPSYIPLNASADATNNFLTINSGVLEEQTIWIWNGSSYPPLNHASSSQFISPGQGFFVKSKAAGGSVSFTTEMQNHQSSSFIKSEQARPEIRLFLTSGKSKKYTDVFYIDNTTKGFDNGYDSSLYSDSSGDFEIFTKLVNQEKDMNLAIQSIPKDFSIVIPVGIYSPINADIEIATISKNLVGDLKIYLEDKKLRTFTLLDNSERMYSFRTDEVLTGSGRFYLHVSSETLNILETIFSDVVIYSSNKKVYLKNLPSSNGFITVFDIKGKQIMRHELNDTNVEISLEKLASTVYFLLIETDKGVFKKKISI